MKANSWIIGILGIWLIITAFLSVSPLFIFWSNLISGVILAIAGFTMSRAQPGVGWVAGIFGIWMIVSAFIPALLSGVGLRWNCILAGLIFLVDGFASVARPPAQTAP